MSISFSGKSSLTIKFEYDTISQFLSCSFLMKLVNMRIKKGDLFMNQQEIGKFISACRKEKN